MASSYTEIYYLEYTGAVDNSGNGVRARFNFQGYNRGAMNLDANATWSVSMSNTDGPMCILMANNQTVSGVTAKILTSGTESGTTTGTLEMYPLTAGTTYRLQAYTEGGTPEVDLTFTPELNNNPRAKDLASGTLAESISASTTSLSVYVGDGSASTIKAVWPDTPFYATLMPASPSAGVPNSLDSEIVKVTAVGNDQVGNTSLTVVRGQKGTTTKAFSEGDVVTNATYAGDAVLLSEEGTSETETPWINAGDIIWSTIIDKIYPVGSIFMSATLSTPSDVGNALGGTWVAWGSGRVPVGVDTSDTDFDTAEETGGEKTHKLVNAELPKLHGEGQYKPYDSFSTSGIVAGKSWSQTKNFSAAGGTQSASTVYGFQIDFGNDQPHNNLQPYITCYMYKRTA